MNIPRRNFFYLLGGGIVTTFLASTQSSLAQGTTKTTTATAATETFKLPPLPYDYAALEPHIDAATMRFHHDKHHAAYVKNMNAAINKYPELKTKSIEYLLLNIQKLPKDIQATVRNSGGGHLNHTMFWEIMSPKAGGAPTGGIAAAIQKDFGSFEKFKTQFNEAGTKQFGSGWVWLTKGKDGKLKISTTGNQDTPAMQGIYPIMGNDVWEHAYYLKYQNRRNEYLASWWNVVNWAEINKRFAKA
jgi:superoxide dismutase, Fe-Mn family